MRSGLATLVLVLGIAGPAAGQIKIPFFDKTPTPDPARKDSDALAKVGLKADDPAGLVAYFKRRTLTDTELKRILGVIKRMGDEDFSVRQQASVELEKVGEAAIGLLRTAEADADPEIGFRAGEVLRRIEKDVSHTAVALAAARALGKTKPKEAAAVLLAYLPVADTPAVEQEIGKALIGLAVRDGAADPALVAALSDPLPIRRGVATVALIEGGDAKQRIRVPAVYPQVKAAVLAEKDADTKFRGLYALLTVARDADAVPALCDLLPTAERGRVWQIEDYLLQLAGTNPPKVKLSGSQAALLKARDEWKAWWDGAKKTVNMETFTYTPKTTGSLLITSFDQRNGWGNAKIVELGPDLKERWRIGGLQAPMDVRELPSGRLMILEQNYSRITERDKAGKILVTRNVPGQPMSFQTLPKGHTLVSFRHQVQEYDADWKPVFTFPRANQDIQAAHRLADGHTLVLAGNQLLKVDAQAKELPDPMRTGNPYWQPRLEVTTEGNVLVTERDKVVEYDLKTKKAVWSYAVQNATSVQRLANGNTLVVDGMNNTANPTVREVTREGEVVWTFAPTDGLRVHRIERR